ncbi:DNA-binding response regulator [Taibaiella soli]|uniref:DNA-binding response regulator n=2 Tax=Taibaiella soli TaxID=1649169 RepID=A0A2W2AWJ3_9BACT|nr:DNA-binding response regulator [Taibaiella soli]
MIIQGLQNMLSRYDRMEIAGTYNDGTELMNGLEKMTPDILLLDIQMPGKTGSELAPLILEKFPSIKIIVLTNFDSGLYAHNMLQSGVKGYLLKTADESMVVKAIEQVYEGGSFVEPSIAEKLEMLQQKTNRVFTTKSMLTQREKQILQLIVDGHTDGEIASKLYLSAYTVKHYRISLLFKLDVKNAAALVKKAIQLGLVT